MGYNIFSRLFKKPKEEQQETVTSIVSIAIIADDEGYLNIDCSFDMSADNIHEVIADTFFCMDVAFYSGLISFFSPPAIAIHYYGYMF